MSIIVRTVISLHHTNTPDTTTWSICATLARHPTRLVEVCTNTCYLSNMYRLHKLDIPNKAPTSLVYFILLMLSGDIEINPGPVDSLSPCGVCQLACNWSQCAVACDNCCVWVHKTCASMDTAEYDQLENVSWKCYCCRSVNVSSFIYNAYNINVSNSFLPLAWFPGDDSVFLNVIASPTERFEPGFHCSPMSNQQSSTTSKRSQAHSDRLSSSTPSFSTTNINNIALLHSGIVSKTPSPQRTPYPHLGAA